MIPRRWPVAHERFVAQERHRFGEAQSSDVTTTQWVGCLQAEISAFDLMINEA